MYLLVLNGKDDGRRVTLSPKTYLIGRASECDIVIPDDGYVSKVHAELIYHTGGKLTLSDRRSKNGVYLLGERIATPTTVEPGHIFCIGRTFLKITRRAIERYCTYESEDESTPESIVVIDIVGSSRIASAMGDHAASKIKNHLHDTLMKHLLEYPAEYVKSTGDGFMVIFTTITDAVNVSVNLLKDIVSEKGFHIRIGIHYGETYKLTDGDRRSLAVDMAFRIESAHVDDMHQTVSGIKKDMFPRIDRIFISEVVQKLIASHSSIKTRCIGFFDLKGFTGRHKIFEVMI